MNADTQGPKVDLLIDGEITQGLRRHIRDSPTECMRFFAFPCAAGYVVFNEAKVRNGDMTVALEQDICKFDITMNDTPGVEIVDSQCLWRKS